MIERFNKMSNKDRIIYCLDAVLLFTGIIMYYLYTSFDELVFGLIFIVVGSCQIIIRIINGSNIKLKFNKTIWISKDLFLIIVISFIYSLILLISKSFRIEYNSYLIFNILFILFILFQIIFDFTVGNNDE